MLHDDERRPVGLTDVEDRHDVGVGERSRGHRLTGEAGAEVLVRRVAVCQHLHGHDAAQHRVRRTVDVGHAPSGEKLHVLVAHRQAVRPHPRHGRRIPAMPPCKTGRPAARALTRHGTAGSNHVMSPGTLARAGAAAVLLSLSFVAGAGGSGGATVPLLVLDRFEASFDQGAHTTRYKATVSSAENRIVAFTWRLSYVAGRCGNFTVTGASNPVDTGSAQEGTVPGLLNTDRYYISNAAYNHEGCTFTQETSQVLTLDIVRSDVPASCRLQFVQTARDGDSPPTPKEMPPTTKTGTCTIETPPPPPPPPPPPKLNAAPPTMTKKEKKEYREAALVATAASATTAGVSLALIEVPPAAAIALIVAGGELLLAEYYVYKAKDPPDPKYKVLAKPIVPTPRLLKPGDGISKALAKAANAYLVNTAQMVAQDRAFIDSLERAQGAHAARDAVWDKRQSDLAAKYARAEAALLDA